MIVRFFVQLLNCLTGYDEVEESELSRRKATTPNCRRKQPADEALLPGLPNSLVLERILPRIPWHVRPLLKATSLAWSQALDGLSPSDSSFARTISRKNDKDSKGEENLVRVQNLKGCEYVISLYDRAQKRWRNLPTLPCGSLPPMHIHAGFLGIRESVNSIQVDYVSGKVIAASICEGSEVDCFAHVWILDIEGGMWKWEKRPSIHTKKPSDYIVSNMIVMEGKVFMIRQGIWDEMKPSVYNVARDEWMELPSAVHDVPLDWYYTIRIDYESEVKTKFVFAWGTRISMSVIKVLDPNTMQWMDYKPEKRPERHRSRRRCEYSLGP